MIRAVAFAAALVSLGAAAKDAKGCKDLDLVPRMPGAEITSCEFYFYGEGDILQAGDRRVRVGGDYQMVEYKQKEGSAAETAKNYENAVTKVGFMKQSEIKPNPVSRTESFLLAPPDGGTGKKVWFQVFVWDDGKGYRLTQIHEQPVAVRLSKDAGAPPPGKRDARGCKDLEGIGRFPNSYLKSCKSKRFDELPVVVWKEGQERAYDRKSVEGELELRSYAVDSNTSSDEIVKGTEALLAGDGWTTKFREVNGRNGTLVMEKGGVWVKIGPIDTGKTFDLARVKTKDVDQLVTANAATMLQQLKSTGRVAVYGINFETGKADIKPESEKVLSEVLKALNEEKSLAVGIEGHTDNVGGAAMNLDLSKKRAEAVKAWLAGKGIDVARLSADGFGDTRPLADNSTEEGRAKNRRVELVKK